MGEMHEVGKGAMAASCAQDTCCGSMVTKLKSANKCGSMHSLPLSTKTWYTGSAHTQGYRSLRCMLHASGMSNSPSSICAQHSCHSRHVHGPQ